MSVLAGKLTLGSEKVLNSQTLLYNTALPFTYFVLINLTLRVLLIFHMSVCYLSKTILNEL